MGKKIYLPLFTLFLLSSFCSCSDNEDINDEASIYGKWQDVTFLADDWTMFYTFDKNGETLHVEEREEGYVHKANGTYSYNPPVLVLYIDWGGHGMDKETYTVLSRDGKSMTVRDEDDGQILMWKKK